MSAFVALGRHVGLACLAGVVAGVLVGGILGRIVMRVSGFAAGPALVGVHTSNGNRVGDITLDGTLGLVLFVGLGTGLVGGVVYAAVEPWLRRWRPWHGLAYGAGLLTAAGSTVLDPANFDFARFGPPALNVGMFAGLFIAFGLAIAWLFDRLRGVIEDGGLAARVVAGAAWLTLLPAGVVAVTAAISIVGGAEPAAVLLFVAPVAIAVVARWRGLPSWIGYAALAVPLVVGAMRTASGLPALLAGI